MVFYFIIRALLQGESLKFCCEKDYRILCPFLYKFWIEVLDYKNVFMRGRKKIKNQTYGSSAKDF